MRDTVWLDGTNLAETEKTNFRPHPLSRFFFIGIIATFLTFATSMIFSGLLQGGIESSNVSESLSDLSS